MDLKTEVAANGKMYFAGIETAASQILVSAGDFSLDLSKNLRVVANGKADLTERRLLRLEQALGLDPICDR